MISLQTNVDALDAINNLNTINAAQGQTIQQLSSGYRINSSADDAAGLAVANSYQNQITQLTEGVNNANDGIAQLQIIDGGLGNISDILNRMQTLATESATGTFTGNRATLNQEYQNLISEITRQANNINLSAGGSFNTDLNVFIGGSSSLTNASVSVNLSGNESAVDATSLGLSSTNILSGGVEFTGNTLALDDPNAVFLSGSQSQTFTFDLYTNGGATSVNAVVSGGANGLSLQQVLSSLNDQLNSYGITAATDSNGYLQFSGSTAFTVQDMSAGAGATGALTKGDTSTNDVATNTANYNLDISSANIGTSTTPADTLTFQTVNGTANVVINADDSQSTIISEINAQTAQYGVYAVNDNNSGISLQSANSFSVYDPITAGGSAGLFSTGNNVANAPDASTETTNNAQAAIQAISQAITNLGLVQGRVGAGENQLNYAIGLAQSQITNFSSAEGDIKDADVATQASNLTRYQVLEQTAVAALAQANSMPQAVLKLLQ